MRGFSTFFISLFLLVLFFPGAAFSGESLAPLSMSLPDALQMARERHVDILVANERVQQALARISQARSGLFPRLDGSVSQYRETVNLKSFGINPQQVPGVTFDLHPPPFNVFDAHIALQQTLFDLTVLRRLKAAHAGEVLSQAEREKAKEDALALVANLYLEAERAEAGYGYVQALLRRDEAKLRDAGNQRQLGLGSSLQVTQSQAALAQIKNRVAQAKAEKEERRLDLVAALGLPEGQGIQFSSRENLLHTPLPSEAEIRTQISFHPDLNVARKQVDLDAQNRRVEVAEYYPKVSGSANFGPNGPHPGDVDFIYSYGGGLSIPIYQGGLRKAKIQESAAKVRESQVQLTQMEKDKTAQAFSALESLRQALVGIKAAEADLARASQELNLARQRKTLGVGNDLEIVDSEAQYANAKDVQSEAIATYRLAWVNLTHRMGNMHGWFEEKR